MWTFLKEKLIHGRKSALQENHNTAEQQTISLNSKSIDNSKTLLRGHAGVRWIGKQDQKTLQRTIVDTLREPNATIPNKFLYFGSHGASAWEAVENAGGYTIKQLSRDLLVKTVDSIYNRILENTNNAPFDIVSLGTGTGGDDVIFLDNLWARCREHVNLFAVDLSSNLLLKAMKNLTQHLESNAIQESATLVHALCIDIENLETMKGYFIANHPEGKKYRLFHLLGLTLGNNYEDGFLRCISKAMQEGDFLLISVDFCLDKGHAEWKEESINSYLKTRREITHFLSGPLITAIEMDFDEGNKGIIKLTGRLDMPTGNIYDFITSRLQIPTGLLDKAPRSDVPEALSIARFYVDADEAESKKFGEIAEIGRLCDFSNKYIPEMFDAWIQAVGRKHGLVLLNPTIREWELRSQHLILLRKMPGKSLKFLDYIDQYRQVLAEIANYYSDRPATPFAAEAVRLLSVLKQANDPEKPPFKGKTLPECIQKTQVVNNNIVHNFITDLKALIQEQD